jgi:hypothetical protein
VDTKETSIGNLIQRPLKSMQAGPRVQDYGRPKKWLEMNQSLPIEIRYALQMLYRILSTLEPLHTNRRWAFFRTYTRKSFAGSGRHKWQTRLQISRPSRFESLAAYKIK